MKKLIPVLLTLMAGFVLPLHAQLKFDAVEKSQAISAREDRVGCTFNFTNETKRRIRIVGVESNCGCMKATTDSKYYDPGQSGKVDAEFNTLGKTGKFRKTVTLKTDISGQDEIPLSVIIDIKPVYTLEPGMVTWPLGAAAAPKKITLRVNDPQPMHITEISTTRKGVNTTVRTVEEGKVYEIEVTPASTAAKVSGAISIKTDCTPARLQRQLAFFRIDTAESLAKVSP